MQCGACCYALFEGYEIGCPYQSIRNEKSFCELHETNDQPVLCRDWRCTQTTKHWKEEEHWREDLRNIALKLGTTPVMTNSLEPVIPK
jgi:hypothetical protein